MTPATKPSTPAEARKASVSAMERGRTQHKAFQQDMKASGRSAEVRMSTLETKRGARPDGVTKTGRSVELKPDSPTGRKAMENQLQRYEKTMSKRGIGVFYDQAGNRRVERTPYTEWKSRPESRRVRMAP